MSRIIRGTRHGVVVSSLCQMVKVFADQGVLESIKFVFIVLIKLDWADNEQMTHRISLVVYESMNVEPFF